MSDTSNMTPEQANAFHEEFGMEPDGDDVETQLDPDHPDAPERSGPEMLPPDTPSR